MKKMFYLLILLDLLSTLAGAYSNNDPATGSSPAMAGNLMMAAVNGATATPLTSVQVLAAVLGTAPRPPGLSASPPDGRTLAVRYCSGPGQTAPANAAPVGEIRFIMASPASTRAGDSLTGNVSSEPHFNLA